MDISAAIDWTPAAGAQSLDLAGNEPGTISQQLQLQLPATASYRVHFRYAGNMYCGAQTVSMTALWNGVPVYTRSFTIGAQTPADPGWKSASFTVSGSAGPATIGFQNTSPGSCGIALDAVSVKQVP